MNYKKPIKQEDELLLLCIMGLLVFKIDIDFVGWYFEIGEVKIGRIECKYNDNNTYYHYLN